MIILKKIKFRNGIELEFSKSISIIYGEFGSGKTTLLNLISELKKNIYKIKKICNLREFKGDIEYELNPEFFEIEANYLIVKQTNEIILITDASEKLYAEIIEKIKEKLNIYYWEPSNVYTIPIDYIKKYRFLSKSELNFIYSKNKLNLFNHSLILLDGIFYSFAKDQIKLFISHIENSSSSNQIILTTTSKFNFEVKPNFSMLELSSDFDNFFYNEIYPIISKIEVLENRKIYNEFLKNIEAIEKLLEFIHISDPVLEIKFYNLLFANIITSMETYLSDIFTDIVLSKEDFMYKLLKHSSLFNEKKYKIGEAYEWLKEKHSKIRSKLSTISFHNLKIIKDLYENVLGISLPENIKKIKEAIEIRHIIIHKNGKTHSGELIKINPFLINDLINEVKIFIYEIDNKISNIIN
ncbi:MAG: hypothetical protein ACTSPQ_12810 [Candidatus Helarchaeota archaeon]